MEITFKKGNAKNTITCKRADGTSTWMEADPFMIVHDLSHYAVETQLNMKNGFYGLLAGGLNITDFEKKQKISPRDIPAEGIKAELLVGLLLTERNDGQWLNDFNAVYQDTSKKFELAAETIDDEVLAKMRENIDSLVNRWKFLPVGNSLVLNFPVEQ